MNKGGDNCNMNNNNDILSIVSPQDQVTGPYAVVGKNSEKRERWAVVALDFDDKPRLGIRWFYGNNGNPISSGYPVWFIIPVELHQAILGGLRLEGCFKEIIEDFLSSGEAKITGDELSSIFAIKSVLEYISFKQDAILSICFGRCRDLVKIRNDEKAREEETQKNKAFCSEVEGKCAHLTSEEEIIQTVKELHEKYFGEGEH